MTRGEVPQLSMTVRGADEEGQTCRMHREEADIGQRCAYRGEVGWVSQGTNGTVPWTAEQRRR